MGIIENNINTNVTLGLNKILIPDLPNKIVIVMDNAAFHRRKKTKALPESKGHIIEFLPSYSTNFDPIERNGLKQNLFL